MTKLGSTVLGWATDLLFSLGTGLVVFLWARTVVAALPFALVVLVILRSGIDISDDRRRLMDPRLLPHYPRPGPRRDSGNRLAIALLFCMVALIACLVWQG